MRRILAATRRLLDRDGPDAINTNRIAKEARVGVGSVYEYFPNKEAIVVGVIDDLSRQETEYVASALADLENLAVADSIRRVIDATFDLYRENLKVFLALYSLTSIMRTVGHRPGEVFVIELVRTKLAPMVDELAIDDIELSAFVIFHMVESLITRMLEHGEGWDQKTCVDEITAVVCRYLGVDERRETQ